MRHLLFVPLFIFISLNSSAQDDTPWWKNLFRKEAVEPLETQEIEKVPQAKKDSLLLEETLLDSSLTDIDTIEEVIIPGHIQVEKSPLLAQLDSIYKENPPKIIGYRIKIYFGDLQSARGIKADYISNGNREGCYVKQYPPNFAVVVGNFRSEEDAVLRLQELKALYPGASVVRDEIETPMMD
jgi:hypothetical protein